MHFIRKSRKIHATLNFPILYNYFFIFFVVACYYHEYFVVKWNEKNVNKALCDWNQPRQLFLLAIIIIFHLKIKVTSILVKEKRRRIYAHFEYMWSLIFWMCKPWENAVTDVTPYIVTRVTYCCGRLYKKWNNYTDKTFSKMCTSNAKLIIYNLVYFKFKLNYKWRYYLRLESSN